MKNAKDIGTAIAVLAVGYLAAAVVQANFKWIGYPGYIAVGALVGWCVAPWGEKAGAAVYRFLYGNSEDDEDDGL